MEIFLISLGILVLLSGPVAFLMCIILFGKFRRLEELVRRPQTHQRTQVAPAQRAVETVKPPVKPPPAPVKPLVKPPVPVVRQEAVAAGRDDTPRLVAKGVVVKKQAVVSKKPAAAGSMLEERIGTRWVLIAGVIAVMFAAAFFLKYAYDNFSISDMGKIIVVTVSGLLALAIGEISRRRGYDIVAKGVTALGFAILYFAVYFAYQPYGFIEVYPAFGLAIVITVAAMAYAVVLDEVLIAFLSLLGGFATPIAFSSGENLPGPLFSYVLILSVGAMLCSYYRRWRIVNILAVIGTYAIYATWYESFFRRQFYAVDGLPGQVGVALGWLGVFFMIYLLMPLLNGLVNRAKASKGDVICVFANSVMVFFYVWNTLYTDARAGLAFCAVGMCVAHFAVMAAVFVRCREDRNLQLVLLALGLVFATVALPLYWKMNALVIAWAAEGVVLALIGIRYRSLLTQVFGAIALVLGCVNLLLRLPMQTGEFDFVFNATFGTWCVVAGAACAGHLLYRFAADKPEDEYGVTAQMLYALMGAILLAAATMEWYLHCRYNLPGYLFGNVVKGEVVIMAGLLALFVLRPLCPRGAIRETLSMVVVGAGSLCMLTALPFLHNRDFSLFANKDFCIVLIFILTVAICHVIYRFTCEKPDDSRGIAGQFLYGVVGGLGLFAVGAEWYFHCKYNFGDVAQTVIEMPLFARGVVFILAGTLLFFMVRPICPRGLVVRIFAIIVAAAGSVYMIAFGRFYDDAFTIFANVEFVTAISFVAALGIAAWLMKRQGTALMGGCNLAVIFSMVAVFVFWVLMTEEIWLYWRCANEYGAGESNWRFLAYMYISIAWALYGAVIMAAGFALKMRILRYMALALFTLLLVKVFVVDTSKVEHVYRIAAFFATGITLVGVSYLYQFLNKKGFFEPLLGDQADNAQQLSTTPDE